MFSSNKTRSAYFNRGIPMPTEVREFTERGMHFGERLWLRIRDGLNRRGGRQEGMYEGRRIISRDMPINGGVYLGEGMREALVVDWETNVLLNQKYNQFVTSKIQRERDVSERRVLLELHDFVKNLYRADENAVTNLIERNKWWDDEKVNIDHFIAAGVGVCRHGALTSGVFIERLIADGYLNGRVSVDRNEGEFQGEVGGHAWARFTDTAGEVTIVDTIMLPKPMLLKDLLNSTEFLRGEVWDYARNEDSYMYS